MINFIRLNHEKLFIISVMDLKLKYQNSIIGFFWSFLKPLLQFVVYFTVFGIMLKVGNGIEYALQLFFGVILWSFFAEATSTGMNSFISKASLISKINVDKLIPPVSAFLTPLMNYLVNFIIFIIIYFLFFENAFDLTMIDIMVFLLSVMQISILILSLNIILSFLNVFFRDVQQIWELILVYGVFLTPIIYTLPIPSEYELLYYSLNPLAFPLENMKISFFHGYSSSVISNTLLWFTHTMVLIFLMVMAYLIQKKLKDNVVDYL